MIGTVLVTGASGFVGSRVVARLAAAHPALRLRLAVHRRPPPEVPVVDTALTDTAFIDTAEIDLADPGSLRGLCHGVRGVVHCASSVGADPATCDAVNARGTRALVGEARRAGVSRIVYLSTAAVYGDGPHRGLREDGAPRRPVSAVSRTRLSAEQDVLRAGGTVLRPNLVYGSGDRWFVPGVLDLLAVLGGLPGDGRALLSLVDVESLARVLVAAVTAVPGAVAGVYHANHPRPVPLRTLCAALLHHLDVPGWSDAELSYEQAHRRLLGRGGSRRHLDMLALDNWFDSTRIWAATGQQPGPGFEACFGSAAPWYRRDRARDHQDSSQEASRRGAALGGGS